MIRKDKKGYEVRSADGKKRLSKKGLSKKAATKRLRQVEYFKHQKGGY